MTKDVQLVFGLALVGGIIYFAHKSAKLKKESKSSALGRLPNLNTDRKTGKPICCTTPPYCSTGC
jgi:hypothetical protein